MEFKVKKGEIIIPQNEDFNIKQTLECGQVFRFKHTTFGYEVYSSGHKASVYCHETYTRIVCDDENYFINYFDLKTDYGTIKHTLKKDILLKEAISYGNGIRILKQSAIETIISFIISANNNIPRIKTIIEKICLNYGTKINDYYAFPTLKQLNKIPKQFFSEIKCGYRGEYLFKTIQLLNSFDLNKVNNLSSVNANKYLTQLYGVGKKVADCILLYGFYRQDVFPTDTWIVKVYNDYYSNGQKVLPNKISEFFVKKYKNYSGYAQQYLYYYKREMKNKGV